LYALWTAVVSGGTGGTGGTGGGSTGTNRDAPPVETPPVGPGGEATITLPAGQQLDSAKADDTELGISGTAENFVLEIPEDLPAGVHDLTLVIDGVEYLYPDGLTVLSLSSLTEVSYWTKRLNDKEAKVYIKNPEYGKKYRILHQTGGSGAYDSILAYTPLDSDDPKLRFAIGSYYFVRTIDLVPGTNRIRVSVDGKDVELRGLLRPVRYDR
jgi:hypothetical protein